MLRNVQQKGLPLTMRHKIRTLCLLVITCGYLSSYSHAEEQPINHKTIMGRELSMSLQGKTVSVEFQQSKKLSDLVADYLRSKGITVVPLDQNPEVTLEMLGAFRIARPGEKGLTGMIGEIAEPSMTYSQSQDSHDTATMKGSQVALTAIVANAISLSQLFTWLSQKTGVSGWINKNITGDPRGFCLSSNCDLISTRLNLHLNGRAQEQNFRWGVQTESIGNQVVFDKALAEGMERLLNPLQLDRAAQKAEQLNAGGS